MQEQSEPQNIPPKDKEVSLAYNRFSLLWDMLEKGEMYEPFLHDLSRAGKDCKAFDLPRETGMTVHSVVSFESLLEALDVAPTFIQTDLLRISEKELFPDAGARLPFIDSDDSAPERPVVESGGVFLPDGDVLYRFLLMGNVDDYLPCTEVSTLNPYSFDETGVYCAIKLKRGAVVRFGGARLGVVSMPYDGYFVRRYSLDMANDATQFRFMSEEVFEICFSRSTRYGKEVCPLKLSPLDQLLELEAVEVVWTAAKDDEDDEDEDDIASLDEDLEDLAIHREAILKEIEESPVYVTEDLSFSDIEALVPVRKVSEKNKAQDLILG